MSIWTIKESDNSIIFVEHDNKDYQSWDIISYMSKDYDNSPVQLPFIACYNGYENCLIWAEHCTKGYLYTAH